MTGVEIKSRSKKGEICYHFSDLDAATIRGGIPAHLTNYFPFNFTNLEGDRERVTEVLRDCAHPELQALLEDGLQPVGRFLKAFGLKDPMFVYTIDTRFYQRRDVQATAPEAITAHRV